jgi:hypothetical protein
MALAVVGGVVSAATGQANVQVLTLDGVVGSFGGGVPLVTPAQIVLATAFSSATNLIDFEIVPVNEILSDQYADLGVIWNDSDSRVETRFLQPAPNERIVDAQFGFPGGDSFSDIRFALSQTGFAVRFPGNLNIQLFQDDTPISSSEVLFPTGGFQEHVAGIVSDIPFNRIQIQRSTGAFYYDIFVQNVVPAPATAALLSLGVLASARRRR